eukprot:m.227582 g.227582  ORF g.227582 m.227582 type:complete len:324 (+) comp18817_c3_seq1:233-1204(+)
MAMAIDITPDDEISFTLPATLKQAPRGIVSRVTLFNPNESLMMYKIKATSTTRFSVKPTIGILQPSASTSIKFTMKPPYPAGGPEDEPAHRFLFMSAPCTEEDIADKDGISLSDQWKRLERERRGTIVGKKLPCVWEHPPENIAEEEHTDASSAELRLVSGSATAAAAAATGGGHGKTATKAEIKAETTYRVAVTWGEETQVVELGGGVTVDELAEHAVALFPDLDDFGFLQQTRKGLVPVSDEFTVAGLAAVSPKATLRVQVVTEEEFERATNSAPDDNDDRSVAAVPQSSSWLFYSSVGLALVAVGVGIAFRSQILHHLKR